MNIILIEFVDEAKALLRAHGLALFKSSETKVISLHPNVGVYLRGQGIAYEDSLPYFNSDSQHRVILASESIVMDLVKDVHFKDQLGMEDSYQEMLIRFLRLYVNHLLWALEVVDGICKKQQVRKFYVTVPDQFKKMYASNGYIHPQERFLGLLTNDYCQAKKIDCNVLKMSSCGSFKIVQSLLSPLNLIAAYFSNQKLRRLSAGDKSLIVPALSYRMDILVAEIKRQHQNVKVFVLSDNKGSVKQSIKLLLTTCLPFLMKDKKDSLADAVLDVGYLRSCVSLSEETKNKINSLVDEWVLKIKTVPENFELNGVSVAPYIEGKINVGLREEILGLFYDVLVLDYIFKIIQPILIMSMYSPTVYFALGELAKKKNVAALNISHGTHVPANNQFERIENYRLATSVIINPYTTVAAQTPWTDKFLDDNQDKRQRLLTGPLLFSVTNKQDRESFRQEVLGENKDFKIVLHASTQRGRHNFRFHITETLDEYISALIDLTNAVNLLEGVYLVIRPHPICNLTNDEFYSVLPKSNRLKILGRKSGSFAKSLSGSDLLVSFSSTCIEEAIQNDIPVIMYDKWQRYNHFNLNELTQIQGLNRMPAYYLTRPDLLEKSIAKALELCQNNPLDSKIIAQYCYPKDYKNNFFKFVNQTLTGKSS